MQRSNKVHIVSVYSEGEDHAFSHHEILLTAFPLALEWLDFDPEQPDKKGDCIWKRRLQYSCQASVGELGNQ